MPGPAVAATTRVISRRMAGRKRNMRAPTAMIRRKGERRRKGSADQPPRLGAGQAAPRADEGRDDDGDCGEGGAAQGEEKGLRHRREGQVVAAGDRLEGRRLAEQGHGGAGRGRAAAGGGRGARPPASAAARATTWPMVAPRLRSIATSSARRSASSVETRETEEIAMATTCRGTR